MTHTGVCTDRQFEAATITKAAIRAADYLHIDDTTLAAILGISPEEVFRIRRGDNLLEKEHLEPGALFLRFCQSLEEITLGDEDVARAWLRGRNLALDAVPLDIIRDRAGLERAIQYLDSRRQII